MNEKPDVAELMAETLINYMSAHETDIALEVDDYGDLLPIFIALIGRKPRGNPHVKPIAHAINNYPH